MLARTKDVRDAFMKEGGDQIKDFRPALEINVPKLSQVAFTADGTYLVICAQDGGGLGVYETQSILQDKKDPAFQLPTNSISVRALSPNPSPDFAHLVAVILSDGKLLIADLKSKDFIKNGSGSPALKEGVAAVSWSNRGKQLTAGMADGNCFQLDQSGTVKASIPAPQLPMPCHVSSLVWLSNNEWLIYYTPHSSDDDRAPDSYPYYVEADKDRSQFVYRAPSADPVGNWGLNRMPLTHYIARLRNWHNIKDWIVLTSVASTDVAMLTNSNAPLVSDTPVTDSYAVTNFANDSSRISVPMGLDGSMDTTAIGMAMDFSSSDKVPQPIPGDEMDESPFPLPALMLLNNEGVLVSSWVVYNDALRNNQPCPDMMSSQPGGGVTSPPQTPQTSAFGASATPGSAFGSSAFAKPAAPSFASFGGGGGSGNAAPAFGSGSAMGQRQSVWGSGGSAPAKSGGAVFGQSSMGAAKPAFGSTSAFGAAATNGSSAFAGGAATSKPAASPFGAFAGSSNNAAKSTPNPFGAFSGSGSTASPFGTMASNPSPFAQQSKPGQSAFASSGTTLGTTPATSFGMTSQPSFGSTVSVDTSAGGSTLGGKSVFGTPAQPGGLFNKPSLTPAETQESDMMDDGEKAATPKEDKPSGLFGMPSGGFKLGTTFKPGNQEDKSDDESEKPKTEARPKGLFGADFGAALGDAQKQREKTASPKIKEEESKETPSLFGIPSASKENEKPKPSIFGNASTSTPKSTGFTFGKPSPTPSSHLRAEPEPPEVQSKPAPSPSATTATESKASSKASKDGSDESGPLAGSEAEAVEMPASDDEDFSEEEEIEPDMPLPPDPSTIKVSKDFYDVNKTLNAKPAPAPPKAPSPQPPQQYTLKSPEPRVSLFGTSTTPAGFPKAPQMFAPPVPAAPKSPRSPSPMRSASTPAGRPGSKPPSRPTSTRPQFAPAQQAPPPARQPTPPPVAPPPTLQDKEAERNREILESSIQPTLTLANYISHQDYVGAKGLTSDGKVSSQIETLFCDINSMVDTLGLNARALTEFVEGHNSMMPDKGRSKDDLDNDLEDEGWCLVEIDELMRIERELGDELDSERIDDKEEKLTELHSMRRELVRAKNKLKEVKRFLEQALDEDEKEQRRNAPLDKGTEARQKEIRKEMARFLKVLVEAEEAVSMLKVKLATAGRQAGGQVPTVEAVEKTVKKMTQWAEEKGADMDVLESQMRKLGLVGANRHARAGSTSKRASLNGSSLRRSGIFATPSPKKSPPKKRGTFAVPEESDEEFVEVESDPMMDAVREMVDVRRKKGLVMGRVRDAIRRKGPRVTEVKQGKSMDV